MIKRTNRGKNDRLELYNYENPKIFSELFVKNIGKERSFCYSVSYRHYPYAQQADLEDIFQESFLTALEKSSQLKFSLKGLESLDENRILCSWLNSIYFRKSAEHFLALNDGQRNVRVILMEGESWAERPFSSWTRYCRQGYKDAEEWEIFNERIKKLNHILSGLPENYREIFLLRYREGLNYEKIKKISGIEPTQAYNMVGYALRILKDLANKTDFPEQNLKNELSEEQRIVMKLFYVKGLNQKEIAKELGISKNAVKNRLIRGRKRRKSLSHKDP